LPGGVTAPDPCARVDELSADLRRALARLPRRQAEAFWLRAVERLSHEEIAAELGIGSENARVLVHRARKALLAALTPKKTRTASETEAGP